MRVLSFPGSNRVMSPTPDRPAIAASQVASTPVPSGVTIPRPVITTLRRDMAAETRTPWRATPRTRRDGVQDIERMASRGCRGETLPGVAGPSVRRGRAGDSLVTIELGNEPPTRPDPPAVPD